MGYIMTIYATPYKAADPDHPGTSVDSGFTSLRQVIKTLGPPPYSARSKGLLIYGDIVDRVLFSRVAFHIDELVNIA